MRLVLTLLAMAVLATMYVHLNSQHVVPFSGTVTLKESSREVVKPRNVCIVEKVLNETRQTTVYQQKLFSIWKLCQNNSKLCTITAYRSVLTPVVQKREVRFNVTECCKGYYAPDGLNTENPICIPLCMPQCVYGHCTDINKCACAPGYLGAICDLDINGTVHKLLEDRPKRSTPLQPQPSTIADHNQALPPTTETADVLPADTGIARTVITTVDDSKHTAAATVSVPTAASTVSVPTVDATDSLTTSAANDVVPTSSTIVYESTTIGTDSVPATKASDSTTATIAATASDIDRATFKIKTDAVNVNVTGKSDTFMPNNSSVNGAIHQKQVGLSLHHVMTKKIWGKVTNVPVKSNVKTTATSHNGTDNNTHHHTEINTATDGDDGYKHVKPCLHYLVYFVVVLGATLVVALLFTMAKTHLDLWIEERRVLSTTNLHMNMRLCNSPAGSVRIQGNGFGTGAPASLVGPCLRKLHAQRMQNRNYSDASFLGRFPNGGILYSGLQNTEAAQQFGPSGEWSSIPNGMININSPLPGRVALTSFARHQPYTAVERKGIFSRLPEGRGISITELPEEQAQKEKRGAVDITLALDIGLEEVSDDETAAHDELVEILDHADGIAAEKQGKEPGDFNGA